MAIIYTPTKRTGLFSFLGDKLVPMCSINAQHEVEYFINRYKCMDCWGTRIKEQKNNEREERINEHAEGVARGLKLFIEGK